MFSVFICFIFVVRTMSQQKLATTASMEAEWTWDRLIAGPTGTPDVTRSALLARPSQAKHIPHEHRPAVLPAALATCTSSKTVNTTSLAKIFYDNLGLTVVNTSFTYYRNANFFRLLVGWGVEVQSFDLTPEHSAAPFTMAQHLSAGFRHLDLAITMETDATEDATEVGEPAAAKPRYDELSFKIAKTIRTRNGATRLTQKPAKSLEHYLKGMRELPEDGHAPRDPAMEMHAALGDELAQEVWHVVLDCDNPDRKTLKTANKQKREKAKQQLEKSQKQKGKRSRRSKRHSDFSNSRDTFSSSSHRPHPLRRAEAIGSTATSRERPRRCGARESPPW